MAELWEAARVGNDVKLTELLSSNEIINIDWKNDSDDWSDLSTPLHISVGCGHLSCVELLLKAGANRNCTSITGYTPLLVASMRNYPAIVSALLAADADADADVQVDIADIYGRTPLIVAACRNHTEVVKLLLDGGANRELKDDNGETALDLAMNHKNVNVVTKIMEQQCLELLVPEVVACSGRALPIELAELCGDFVVFTTKRREITKRARTNIF